MPPPFSNIKDPMTYDEWTQSGRPLFPNGTSISFTRAYDHATEAGMRIVYGFTKKQEFWFFMKMTPSEERAFWGSYGGWLDNQTGSHEFGAFAGKPPTCGTPNTPTCPPPPRLEGAIENLTELLAGAGATKEQLAAAREKVLEMLATTCDGVAVMITK
jgi:hypothetical protein